MPLIIADTTYLGNVRSNTVRLPKSCDLLSYWLALRGRGWGSMAREFLAMAVVNLGLVYLEDFLQRRGGGALNLQILLFFVLR